MTLNCYILFALNCNCSQWNLYWQTIRMNPVHSIHKLWGDFKGIPEVSILTEPDQRWFAFLTFLAFNLHLPKEEDPEEMNLRRSSDRAGSQKFFFEGFHRLTHSNRESKCFRLDKQVKISQVCSSQNIQQESIKYHLYEQTEHCFWQHIQKLWLLWEQESYWRKLSFFQ